MSGRHGQTLGNHEGVASWADHLGSAIDQDTVLPPELLHGSFRGSVVFEDGDTVALDDFAVVFRDCKLAGKGTDSNRRAPFIVTGLYSRVEGEVRLVLTKYFHNPDRKSPIEDRHEMRCVLSDHTQPPGQDDAGTGFSGDVFAMDGSTFRKGRVFLWPTPPQLRDSGFLSFTFHSPVCGLEHTGAFTHWTGLGAEVKRAHGPSQELGMQPGDVIKAVNNEPITQGLRSRDVSAIIKQAARPMVVVVWREAGQNPRHSVSNLEDINENNAAAGGEAATHMLQSFSSVHSATHLLREDMMSAIESKREMLDRARQRKKDVNRADSLVHS